MIQHSENTQDASVVSGIDQNGKGCSVYTRRLADFREATIQLKFRMPQVSYNATIDHSSSDPYRKLEQPKTKTLGGWPGRQNLASGNQGSIFTHTHVQ